MAAHSPDHHYTETKPVSFTVPFILAAVTLLVMGLFLSLCDPSRAHHDAAAGHGAAKHGTQSNDGHHNATDKEMQNYGEHGDVPPAHPESPAQGVQHR